MFKKDNTGLLTPSPCELYSVDDVELSGENEKINITCSELIQIIQNNSSILVKKTLAFSKLPSEVVHRQTQPLVMMLPHLGPCYCPGHRRTSCHNMFRYIYNIAT